MSAQVTEAHLALASDIMLDHTPGRSAETVGMRNAAQLIADSEARAIVAAFPVEAIIAERDQLRDEVERLRHLETLLNQAAAEVTAHTFTAGGIAGLRAEAELATCKESLHLADGTANLALVHRDAAEAELTAERAKVRVLHSALQNLADEQNGAPLERRREEWQEAMDEACAVLAATEEAK